MLVIFLHFKLLCYDFETAWINQIKLNIFETHNLILLDF